MKRIGNMSIAARINLIVAIMGVLAVGISIVGHIVVDKVGGHFKTVYEDRLVPMEQLTGVGKVLSANRSLLLGLESADADAAHRIGEQIATNASTGTELWKQYLATRLTPEEKQLADQFTNDRGDWLSQGLQPAIQAMRQGDTARARRLVNEFAPLFNKTMNDLELLQQMQVRIAKEEYYVAERSAKFGDWIMISTLLLGLAGACAIAFLLARSITRPIGLVVDCLNRMEHDRDLTLRVDIPTRDECGRMGAALNSLASAMESAMRQVKEQASQVSDSAVELAGASRTILDSTSAQSEAAASTAASVQELAVSVTHVADSAGAAAQMASQSAETSSSGAEVVQSAAEEMDRIADDVRASSGLAQSLDKRSNDISGIVQVIKDVAEQTNLLALNAAIEAARAGEQGRGFAVVADEVRKLAERTARSTAEITELIQHVQADTRAVVGTMDTSIGRVSTGVEYAKSAATALVTIRDGTHTTQEKIAEIASATKEQSTASNDIARHVERIAQMTEENSAAATQAAELAARLEDAARSLRGQVEGFKTA